MLRQATPTVCKLAWLCSGQVDGPLHILPQFLGDAVGGRPYRFSQISSLSTLRPTRVKDGSFLLKPGSTLRIQADETETNVIHHNGDETTVSVKATWSEEKISQSFGSARFRITERTHDKGTSFEVLELFPGPPGNITAWAPRRYCGLDASTGGGQVLVEDINEGPLKVVSRGGDVKIYRVRGDVIHINTAGGSHLNKGSITAQELSAEKVELQGGGAPITIDKMFGREVKLVNYGAPLSVKAAYVDNLKVESGGGALHVGVLDCQGQAHLDTAWGDIRVDSLDGNVSMTTTGGHVQVQLNDRVGEVNIESHGGHVECFISPAACAYIHVEAGGGVAVAPDLKISGRDDGRVVHGHVGQQGKSIGPGTRTGPEVEGNIRIISGSGKVVLRSRDWAGAVQAQLADRRDHLVGGRAR